MVLGIFQLPCPNLLSILHPNFGPWSLICGELSINMPIYSHVLLCSAAGIPCRRSDRYCLEAASLILPFIHSPIYPPLLLSVSVSLPSLHTSPVPRFQWQLPPLSHSGHSGITPDIVCPNSLHFLSWFLFPHIKFSHYVIFKLFNLQVLHLVLADTPI